MVYILSQCAQFKSDTSLTIPITTLDILEQSFWLNKYIEINNETVYWRSWINAGILHISDNVHNGTFLPQDEIQFKYNLTHTIFSYNPNPRKYT